MKGPISITIGTAADGLSNAVDLNGTIGGIIMPAAWTAAGLTFLAAPASDGTYGSIYDDAGVELGVTSANAPAGRTIVFTDTLREKLRCVRYLKVRSGTAAAAVQQAAARTLTLLGI